MVVLIAGGNVATIGGYERQQTVMPILKAGVLYFALVFGAVIDAVPFDGRRAYIGY
jgi:hypothetical protein